MVQVLEWVGLLFVLFKLDNKLKTLCTLKNLPFLNSPLAMLLEFCSAGKNAIYFYQMLSGTQNAPRFATRRLRERINKLSTRLRKGRESALPRGRYPFSKAPVSGVKRG